MRTCPAPGCGTSRSTISKSPPGLGTCTAFIGANATLVVAMLPSGWNLGVPHVDRFAVTRELDAARLRPGTAYLGATYRLTRFRIRRLRGWPTGLLVRGARDVHDECGPIVLLSVLLGVDGRGGAEEQIGGVGDEGGSEVGLVEVLLALNGVFVAEARARIRDGHAATAAAGGAILTMERDGSGVGDGGSSLGIHVSSFPAGAGMFQFGNCWYTPPCFSERVCKGLKAKSLDRKMWCTENGRVRNSKKGKGIERAARIDETDRADPPRRAGGGQEGGIAWRIMLDITTEE